jgi:hypothetical protein
MRGMRQPKATMRSWPSGLEHGGKIEEDRVIPRGEEVVHHHTLGNGDGRGVCEVSVLVGHVVAQEGLFTDRVVAEEDEFARFGAPLRVCSEGAFEFPAEVEQADRIEFACDLRCGPALPKAEVLVRVANDVGVRRVLEDPALDEKFLGRELEVQDAAEERLAGVALVAQSGSLDPLVLVAGAPVLEIDGVHHAVTVEPVVAAERLELRVGAVAHVHAVQRRRNLSGDVEIGNLEFVEDGCVGSAQERADRGEGLALQGRHGAKSRTDSGDTVTERGFPEQTRLAVAGHDPA